MITCLKAVGLPWFCIHLEQTRNIVPKYIFSLVSRKNQLNDKWRNHQFTFIQKVINTYISNSIDSYKLLRYRKDALLSISKETVQENTYHYLCTDVFNAENI